MRCSENTFPIALWALGQPARVFSYITGMDGIFVHTAGDVGLVRIPLFLFSAFSTSTGAGQFFIDIAMAVAGGKRGGLPMVAVIGSALFGTISATRRPTWWPPGRSPSP